MTMVAFLTHTASIVEGLQTEIALFLLAFLLHALVFGRHGIKRSPKPVGKQPSSFSKDGGRKIAGGSTARNSNSPRSTLNKIRNQISKQQTMIEADQSEKANMSTYNATAKMHLLNGDMRQVQDTFETMRAVGLKPNLPTLNNLLEVAVKNRSQHAWDLVGEMKKFGSKPNNASCAILLKSSCTPANLDRVISVVNDMDEAMDEVLFNSLVEACLRAGRPDFLESFLKQCSNKHMKMKKSAHTYSSLIRAYGFLKDIPAVWKVWHEMQNRHVAPNSIILGCMVEALVTNGDVEAGYTLIHDISKDEAVNHQLNAVIYCSILKGFAQQKEYDRVWSVYQEMLDLKLRFSISTFNALVDACARSREMNRIPALLESMVAQGIVPNLITYSAIVKGYCQANRLDEAFQLLKQMLQTTSFRPDEIMYNTLLDGCARQGLYDKGMTLLEEMQQVGVAPTNFTLSVLVKLACRSRHLDCAFELCESISSKYKFRLNMHVYSNLVNGCVSLGQLERALDVFDKMLSERVRPDARTYQGLLRACIGEKRAEDAAGLLRAAMGLRVGHPRFAERPTHLLKPQGGLSMELIEEVLQGVSAICADGTLAVQLLQDLRRQPGLKLDPKLQLKLATNLAHAEGLRKLAQ